MSNEIFVKVCISVITILSALITTFVIPYIKSKISQQNLDKLIEYTKIAVRCAEQIYTPEQWKEKKQYVMDYLLDLVNNKLNINITENELDVIVEGIVNEIKHGSNQLESVQ